MYFKSSSLLLNTVYRLKASTDNVRQVRVTATATPQTSCLGNRSWGGNGPFQSRGITGSAKRVEFLALLILLLVLSVLPALGQTSPPSRPILFVHGFCGDAGSWAHLVQALSVSVAKDHAALYPNLDTNNQQRVYKVYYDSIADQVYFIDPDTGETVDEMWILPSTRFFEIAFYDSANASFDANIVANISILNKAYELSRVIKEVTKITQIKDVIVVAHSMGGLVARAYMENLASPGYCWDPGSPSTPDYTDNKDSSCHPGQPPARYGDDIADVITIDTPHGGTSASSLSVPYPLLACALQPSTTKTEMIPKSSLLQALNYYGDPNGQLPSAAIASVPLQSLESYFANEPNPYLSCYDSLTDNSNLTDYCDDLITSTHQAVRQNLESSHRAELSSWTDIGNPFSDQDTHITQDTADCWVPVINGNIAKFRMLHFIECLGNQSQTQTTVYSLIDPIVSGQLTSITVQATYNGQPWSGSLSYPIVFQNYSSMNETTVPQTVSDVPVGTYYIPAYDLSGGPPADGPPTITASPSPTIQTGQWTITFTIAFTKKTPSSTTTTVSASLSQVSAGTSVALSAKVISTSGAPTGTVTFYDSGNAIGSALVNNAGIATYTTSSLPVGSNSITANYGGDVNFSGSISTPVTVAVTSVSPVIAVTPSTGTIGVTSFSKSGAGFTPNGTITQRVTYPNNEVDTVSRAVGSSGTYGYSIIYSKQTGTYYQTDTDNTSGLSSKAISWIVSPVVTNDFSLTASPVSQSVSQGSSVGYNIVTATTSGSAQNIVLSASNIPSGLTATFNPITVSSGVQSALTITASSSTATGTYTITIIGTGASVTHTYQVSVTVAQAVTGPAVTLTPSIVRFNSQAVGSVSTPQTVMLMNSGSGQLKVSNITLLAGSDYVLTLPSPTPPSILNALVPYNFQVAFEPTTTGSRPGEILVYDNAPGSPHIVSLTGTGTSPQPSAGTINVNATLNGTALPSSYYYGYSLSGPTPSSGGGAYSYSVSPGSYTIAFSGNPSYFTLSSVTPSTTQSVAAGGSITYTMNFTAPNDFYAPSFGVIGNGGTPQIVTAGSTANYYIILGQPLGSASTPIALAVSGVPPNSNSMFNPQPAYSATSSALTVGTTSSTPIGAYTLNLNGTNTNGLTRQGSTSTLVVTAPATTPVQLASKSSSGVQANSASSVSSNSVSADGRYVVFSTSATNLVTGNTHNYPEIYVRDLQSSATTAVSVSSSGVLADSYCYGGSISANGRYVVFWSDADNLYSGTVYNGNAGVYVRDLSSGTTEREDIATDGTPGNGNSSGAAISADGRFVVFVSNSSNLISGVGGMQAYLRDRKTGKTALVSVAMDGTPASAVTNSVAISADGRFVAFISYATTLVSQNTNGLAEAFVRDMETGITSLVSVSSAGVPANASIFTNSNMVPLALSADGRYVAFSSSATNLVSESLDGSIIHVFLYDRQLQQNILVDVDSVGTPLGGWSSFTTPAISADGRFITFFGFLQVLVRDIVAEQTAVVSLASNGNAGNNTTYSPDLSVGGPKIVFASGATNLVASDTNGVDDAFVAQNPFVGSSPLQTMVLSSSSTSGGNAVTGTVTLSNPAPTGGATVTVWSNNAAAQPPASIVIPAGVTSTPFSIPTSLVPTEELVTIMASYNGGSSAAVLTLEPAAELAINPTTWDYDYQAVSTSSAAEVFALTNSGTAALTINSIQLASGTVFSISANTCGSSIAAGDSCSVSVIFKPTASGSASDSLNISYGSPATIQPISLTGNGATPNAALSPTPLSFGNQVMPGSAVGVVTLTNSGNASLTSIFASISGTNAGDFAISSDGCTGMLLPANSNCLVSIAFTPKAKGSRQATLLIADSASGSPQAISLTGTGIQSTPTILWNPSATSLAYGIPLGNGVLDATANQNGVIIAGTFAYTATINGGTTQPVTQVTVLGAGMYTLTAFFTPADGTDYTTATATTTLTVNKATSSVTAWPTASSITYGQTLASSTLSGGASTPVGSFAFTTPTTAPGAGTASQSVTFTPTDASDYSTLTGTASVTVNKATPSVTTWPTASSITYGQTLASSTLSGGASTPVGSFAFTTPTTAPGAGTASQSVTFTPTDATDYSTLTGTASVMVNNPVPVISRISPLFTNAGGVAFPITVNGLGFTASSTVYWGTSALTTTYGSATQLTAQVTATDIASGGTTAAITVITPSPGGGTSNAFQFEVNSASGSTTGPTFTSVTATVTAGSPASYPVTLPSTVESASVTCLNLPTGAACSYSATTNTVTITTSATTPKGTYQITVVFTETVAGAATSWILLPILLLPLVFLRRKLAARSVWVTTCLGLVLLAGAAYTAGCGGSSGGSSSTPPAPTHQVVSSGTVGITIQ